MSNEITITLVSGADGSIDREASEAVFDNAVTKFIQDTEVENAQIVEHISAVFDNYIGKALQMPVLVSFVLNRMNCQPENFNTLGKRVSNYVRDNSKLASPTYSIIKGAGGGVRKIADSPANK